MLYSYFPVELVSYKGHKRYLTGVELENSQSLWRVALCANPVAGCALVVPRCEFAVARSLIRGRARESCRGI